MEYKDIDTLLEKYMACESSLEEEKQLRLYFQTKKEFPEKHLKFKYLFRYFEELSKEKSAVKLEEILEKSKPSLKVKKIIIWAMAASIALLISVFVFNSSKTDQKVYAYINGKPVADKDVAIAEAQKALLLISNNLNEGTSNLNHLKAFNKAEEILKTN